MRTIPADDVCYSDGTAYKSDWKVAKDYKIKTHGDTEVRRLIMFYEPTNTHWATEYEVKNNCSDLMYRELTKVYPQTSVQTVTRKITTTVYLDNPPD